METHSSHRVKTDLSAGRRRVKYWAREEVAYEVKADKSTYRSASQIQTWKDKVAHSFEMQLQLAAMVQDRDRR